MAESLTVGVRRATLRARARRRACGAALAALFALWPLAARAQHDDGWRPLFNGRDLSGWSRADGLAEFRVEDGAIVGTTRNGTPNTFLVFDEPFGDFALELEFLVDPAINSGVQIRSERGIAEVNFGRTHGYQVEIDPSERAWTAGIYDEGRRGWLFPMTLNPVAQSLLRQGEWNQLYVEARGETIRTWLNGVPAAYLVDEMTSRGFIALQVHAARSPAEEGREVRFRGIRIRTDDVEPRGGDFPFVVNTVPNSLNRREEELGWRLAWDGETTRGWRGAHRDEFPARGWIIEDGTLTVVESGGREAKEGGDILTVGEYGAFELQLEFRFAEGANSGIKYFVTEGYDPGGGSAIGLEYQILDDERHPDAQLGRDGNRTLAALYDLIPARREPRFVHGPGEWNHARLVVRADRSVEHWLNHMKVLEYVRGSSEFLALVAESKYRNWEGFGLWKKGHVLLQDHGNRVSFRSIKIRPLVDE